MRRLLTAIITTCLMLTACGTIKPDPDIIFYDGSGTTQDKLVMGSAYEFPEYDTVPGFNLTYESDYDGRTTDLRINDGTMTYGDVLEKYQNYFTDDQYVAQDEYIEMLGFSAISVTPDSLSYETKSTFSRKDVLIEQAESFDIIYYLTEPKINGYFTTDTDRMIDVLGRPRFAAISWRSEDEYEIDYIWDMGNDRYLTILTSGAIRFLSGEFLCQSRPMFEPFLTKGD